MFTKSFEKTALSSSTLNRASEKAMSNSRKLARKMIRMGTKRKGWEAKLEGLGKKHSKALKQSSKFFAAAKKR
jgi:hypothetical protein